jgi:predicted DNA-binding antitoxin AbrB/MazE fold protein
MTMTINAIVDGGALRPAAPLDLPDGTEVQVVILPVIKGPMSGPAAAEVLAAIAALPTTNNDPWTSRDHDKILYGEEVAR